MKHPFTVFLHATFFLFGFAALLVPVIGNASTKSNACFLLDTNQEQQECYELLLTADNTLENGGQSWHMYQRLNNQGNPIAMFLVLDSNNKIDKPPLPKQVAALPPYQRQERIKFRIKCSNKQQTSLWFWFAGHRVADFSEYRYVQYKVDNNPIHEQGFSKNHDSDALGLWNNEQSVRFIRSLLGHERLLIAVRTPESAPVYAEFDISDLDRAIVPLRTACGW